jgi:hypothetical protein
MNTPDLSKRVVCAACKSPWGDIILGVRHWDALMRAQFKQNYGGMDVEPNNMVQGFANTWGEFLTRNEAWIVACANDQILRYVGNQSAMDFGVTGELYSENLY